MAGPLEDSLKRELHALGVDQPQELEEAWRSGYNFEIGILSEGIRTLLRSR